MFCYRSFKKLFDKIITNEPELEIEEIVNEIFEGDYYITKIREYCSNIDIYNYEFMTIIIYSVSTKFCKYISETIIFGDYMKYIKNQCSLGKNIEVLFQNFKIHPEIINYCIGFHNYLFTYHDHKEVNKFNIFDIIKHKYVYDGFEYFFTKSLRSKIYEVKNLLNSNLYRDYSQNKFVIRNDYYKKISSLHPDAINYYIYSFVSQTIKKYNNDSASINYDIVDFFRDVGYDCDRVIACCKFLYNIKILRSFEYSCCSYETRDIDCNDDYFSVISRLKHNKISLFYYGHHKLDIIFNKIFFTFELKILYEFYDFKFPKLINLWEKILKKIKKHLPKVLKRCYYYTTILYKQYFKFLNKTITKNYLLYDCNQLFNILLSEEMIFPDEICNKIMNECIKIIEENKSTMDFMSDNKIYFHKYCTNLNGQYDQIKTFIDENIVDENLKSAIENNNFPNNFLYRFMLLQKYISHKRYQEIF